MSESRGSPDTDAEREILLRVFAESRPAITRIVAHRDRADDVFQEAMVILLLRLRRGGLTEPESARQFVYGVARRLEANLRRKDQRRRTSTSLDDTVHADPAPSALERLLLRERRDAVRLALTAMHPLRDRVILYRLYVLDHDRHEVREAFGLSASGFDRVLCRARERFRRLLAPAGERFGRFATVVRCSRFQQGGEPGQLARTRPHVRSSGSHERRREEQMNTVCFGLAERYDNGRDSSVAMRGERIVEVHKSQNEDDLWYRVGQVALGIVKWGESQKYDTGITPAVAFSGVHVVDVHRSQNRPRLFYRVGAVDVNRISWGSSDDYDDGEHPRVAVNAGGTVVEVHATYNDPGDVRRVPKFDLWFRVGKVRNKKIEWAGKSQKYTTGKHPSVALFDDGTVVEMHESETTAFVHYRVGRVNGGAITWQTSQKYVEGRAPVVACHNESRQLVEVHEEPSDPIDDQFNSAQQAPMLTSAMGTLAGASVQWGARVSFDRGRHPGVAYWDRYAVQTHGGESRKELWSSLSLVADRKEWMLNQQALLDQRPLLQITMPATHDSGMYRAEEERVPEHCRDAKDALAPALIKPYAIAQKRDIGGQLAGGVRYFDLRLYAGDGEIRAYHDVVGPPIAAMLDQVAAFLGSVRRELVILQFKNFCSFSDDDHRNLIAMIQEKLGRYLYEEAEVSGEALLRKTFSTLTLAGPRVLIDYRSDYVKDHPASGFWRAIPTFDEYSSTESYAAMRKDQLDKLKQNANKDTQLYLLSWTLTMVSFSLEDKTLHGMSKEANPHLGSFCNEWAPTYRINFLYVDFFEDARPTDIAIQMNLLRK